MLIESTVMKLFHVSSNKQLAEAIIEQGSCTLGKYELVQFGDSEIKPVIKDDVRGETCIIIASTSNPVNDAYMELFLMIDALRRGAAGRIVVVMPYMGYARQNQQHLPGEPVSAQVMVKFLETIGVDEFISVDLHEEQLTGVFSIPMTHLSGYPLLAKHIGEEIVAAGLVPAEKARLSQATTRVAATSIVVVSPDQGGVERTRAFRDSLAEQFEGTLQVAEQTAVFEKKRNLDDTHNTKGMELSGESVKDAIAIIPDDVIVSGGTIVNAAHAVREAGASHIYICATHADFIDGTVEKLKSVSDGTVVVTDTIPIKDEWKFDGLKVVPIAPVLGDVIQKLQ
jgi:ribose-phosphate pyrophosphokinase